MTRHLILPDCQIKPGDDLQFQRAIGNYIVDKKPDVIINIGDYADMPSLCSYDVGQKSFEGRRYKSDIEAAHKGMETLLGPLQDYNRRRLGSRHKTYLPNLILCLGNHEERINKAIEKDAKLEGVLSVDDLQYESWGWNVHPFLEVVIVNGVAYSHYLVTGVAGRPAGSAAALLRKANMSIVCGHQQGRQVAYASRADGVNMTAIIAGSCYESPQSYLGPQGNKHWNGVVMLNEVDDGGFDEMFVSLAYLKRRYL